MIEKNETEELLKNHLNIKGYDYPINIIDYNVKIDNEIPKQTLEVVLSPLDKLYICIMSKKYHLFDVYKLTDDVPYVMEEIKCDITTFDDLCKEIIQFLNK